jgi:hypothetical protein
MLDITKIQLNSIPPPIAVLQNTNTELQGKNKLLGNILIVGFILLSIYIADRVITYTEEESE